jgi:hypothetical protein
MAIISWVQKIFQRIKDGLRVRRVRRRAYVMQVIRFGEVSKNGLVFDKDAKIAISGKVGNMHIDESGIKVIDDFDLESISFIDEG